MLYTTPMGTQRWLVFVVPHFCNLHARCAEMRGTFIRGQEFGARCATGTIHVQASRLPRFCHSFRAYFANYRAIKSHAARPAIVFASNRHSCMNLAPEPLGYIRSLAHSSLGAPARHLFKRTRCRAANKINLSAPYKKRRLPFFNSPPTDATERAPLR